MTKDMICITLYVMPKDFNKFFSDPSIQILFATAPTGLGHIRVTEALKSELDKTIKTETIGIINPTSQFLYRIVSQNMATRWMMEFLQTNPIGERAVAWFYTKKLRSHTRSVRLYLQTIIEKQKRQIPNSSRGLLAVRNDKVSETVVIVATHFALAHQIAACKKKIERNLLVKIILAVVVTDDSPQIMWAVRGADYIFVPSILCKKGIQKELGEKIGTTKVIVSAYPLSKNMQTNLSEKSQIKREVQVDPHSHKKLKILIPISGAAIGLSYFQSLIPEVTRRKDISVTVVSRDSSYTKSFIHWCKRQKQIHVLKSTSDHNVVLAYEKQMRTKIFAVEITKPSEQSFKALLHPEQKGGLILLFSKPVGRQEYDNSAFLKRHGLMPGSSDEKTLSRLFYFNQTAKINQNFLERAKAWRGIEIPWIGVEGGVAIMRLYETGILKAMSNFESQTSIPELRSDGSRMFWERMYEEISNVLNIF
jgi:hypothetical protein